MLCPCGLVLSSGPPLSGGVYLGLSSSPVARCLDSGGMSMHKIQGKLLLLKKIIILLFQQRDSASKTKTLSDFPRGKRPQNQFLTAVAKVAV
jgi:hypothetical protein